MQSISPAPAHGHHPHHHHHHHSCCDIRHSSFDPTPRRAVPPRLRRSKVAGKGEESGDVNGERLLLVERYRDGSSTRYLLDDKSQLQIFWEDHEPTMKEIDRQTTELSWLPNFVKEFILPAGFPDSVSEDYLDYMTLQFSTNVTGWVCHTLVTSSLLQAVGIGKFSGATAAASAAAIRWVSKDGLGSVGRLLIGGKFGKIFDDDPKQWRMYADFVGSAGSIFELATPLYPEYFLLLASVGNLAKAVAKGLKDPSFRVIQNHFSVSGNLGEVAAKEEVWEVAAQLLGLSLGILLLDTPGLQNSYFEVAITWFGIRMIHLWFRYQSLSILRFPTVNLKRARILVRSHVQWNIVPGFVACNKEEDILLWERFLRPRILFGASIKNITSTGIFRQMMQPLVELYCKEKHILIFHEVQPGQPEFIVAFKIGATNISMLRSLWQVYWLNENWMKTTRDIFDALEESLLRLEVGFDDFLEKLGEAGWSHDAITLKVPKEVLVEDASRSEIDLHR